MKAYLPKRFLKQRRKQRFMSVILISQESNNYLRITIGTREEMETLLDFLKEFTATK